MRDRFFKLKIRMLFNYRLRVRDWYHDVWKRDGGARMCCSGYECGCYGSCYADWWEYLLQEKVT